tara:strand:- start:1578 stop:2855 length:1278 start_codon:yes stop_codon:yes gene_type:complete
MAKEENKVVEEVQPTEEVKTESKKVDEPVLQEGGDMKIKSKPKKPKQLGKQDNSVAKIDLSKAKEETKVAEETVAKVDLSKKEEEPKQEEKVVEEVVEEKPKEEVVEKTPVLEEITEEQKEEIKEEIVESKTEELQDEVEQAVQESQETGVDLPENIQKVVEFMNETGGTLEDYVRLNQDYSNYDDNTLLREYYKQTKSHLTDDEISFLMEDQFSYDEETDEERDIRRKKLALKEQVASAKSHLDGLKSKYYDEIKAGVKLTPDQKKAVDFFNRYNKEQEVSQKDHEHKTSIFNKETNKVFNQNFKGFEYKVGDKRYRFNVKDADKVKSTQSDITNFVKKFLNDKNEMSDANGYHKSLFTAMNADAIANHFYEQGRADAIKDSVAKAKNVSMDPRQTHKTVEAGGMKVRAITGDDSNAFRVKIRK